MTMTTQITVKVRPGAGRNEVSGLVQGAWQVKVSAAPEKGKANEAVVRLLAERLDVSRSQVTIERGLTSRVKTLAIHGLTPEQVAARLAAASADGHQRELPERD